MSDTFTFYFADGAIWRSSWAGDFVTDPQLAERLATLWESRGEPAAKALREALTAYHQWREAA